MDEITAGVNWLAVIVGAVVSFLVGWAWYSTKLFGVKWAEGSGVSLGDASEMPVGAMVSQIIGLLLMSWFVGVTAVSSALFLVILATIAFTVMAYSSSSFSQKSAYARFVDAGYWIVCLVVMIAAQAIL